MERSELVLSGILILAVAAGAFWNAQRIHSSGLHPVVVENGLFPLGGNRAEDAARLPSSPVSPFTAAYANRNLLGKRDVNRASALELAEVRGIGPVLSNEIVSYRDQHGPFRMMEDLLRVPGIGPSRLDAISELFEVTTEDGVSGGAVGGPGIPASVPSGTTRRAPLPAAGWSSHAEEQDSRLDVNLASATELMAVPGIGPVLAERIIRFREGNGPFETIDELTLVSGIGPKRLEAFSVYLRAGSSIEAPPARSMGSRSWSFIPAEGGELSPTSSSGIADRLDSGPRMGSIQGSAMTKIDLNTATKEQLMSLPGIGSVLADRIIQERRAGGRFQTPADIQRVSGIGPKKFEAVRDLIEAGP